MLGAPSPIKISVCVHCSQVAVVSERVAREMHTFSDTLAGLEVLNQMSFDESWL